MTETSGSKAVTNGTPAWLVRLEAVIARHRLSVNIAIHSLLFALSLLLAYLVRFDIGFYEGASAERKGWFLREYIPWLPFFVGIKLIIFGRMKLFRGGWQFASIRDVTNILLAAWLFVLVTFAMVWGFHYYPHQQGVKIPYGITEYFDSYSRGVLVLDFLGTVFLVCTARLGFRLYREEMRPVSSEGVQRVLIVGAGDAAETILREIFRMRVERYRVVGLVDDSPSKKGILIHGVQVLGQTKDIRQICQDEKVDEIIIAIPSATQKQMRRVIELCSGTKLKFQSLPSVGDLIDGRVTVSQMRPVDINDLLGREQVELDCAAVAKFIQGRKLLITGAGGSIGSEMCRQVCNFGPMQLILLEQAETPLFDIENELRKAFPNLPIAACICDIYDRERVMQIWSQYRPDVVIHAAAHKHVPLMERNPCEAIKNNIIGSRNVADASCKYDAAEFVTISTDKAVNPSSIMGASKRVVEIYTQSLNGRNGCKTQFKAVRFGNVLGSAGSVVPTFRKQIQAGGPVTVTHPEMTRYFMTIPEAAQLVLQAAATGTGGQIYLLDMGEPVKIVDLARQMITLSGFRPDEDIEIAFTGMRPGEKLFEELRTDGEDMEPTVHPKVRVWRHRLGDWDFVQNCMEELASLQNCNDRDKILAALKRLIPEYQPLNQSVSTAALPTPVASAPSAPHRSAAETQRPAVEAPLAVATAQIDKK